MYDPIAYTYEADHHCEACAERRFGRDENDEITGTDAEGNEVGVVAPWDEWWFGGEGCESLNCGDCHAELATAHDWRCDETDGETCTLVRA